MEPSSSQNTLSTQVATLKTPLKGRRVFAWLLFLCVSVLCLLIPMLASVTSPDTPSTPNPLTGTDQATRNAQPTWLALDYAWNPGPLSRAHQPWAKDCKACHSEPFVQVQDKDCVACHTSIAAHTTSTTSKVPDDSNSNTRCASCHREHKGDFALLEQNRHFVGSNCADCHNQLSTIAPDTQVMDVSDFTEKHPDFRIQIGSDATTATRLRQSSDPAVPISEPTNLKFPHDVHTASNGINSPQGTVILSCTNCHVATADNKHFEPVTMKEHCQSCHALSFEPAMPDRQVPHGSVDDALTTLREFYSYASLNGITSARLAANTADPKETTVLSRPGHKPAVSVMHSADEDKAENQSFLQSSGDAHSRASASATRLFEKTACVVCHSVESLPGPGKANTPGQDLPQWHISPPTAQHPWMPNARFNHAKHKTSECSLCHNAQQSNHASDVLMPKIDTCRSCHVGSQPDTQKINSDCGLCHRFHPREKTIQSAAQSGMSHEKGEEPLHAQP